MVSTCHGKNPDDLIPENLFFSPTDDIMLRIIQSILLIEGQHNKLMVLILAISGSITYNGKQEKWYIHQNDY